MDKISATIITFNEEDNIERCVLSAFKVADEVVVVDSLSQDKTVEIAKSLGCKVFDQKWLGYSEQKNLANSKAQYNFILSLDADEVLSDELVKSILEIKNTGLSSTYSFNRLTNYCGSWIKHSGWYPDVKSRLFPKEGVKWEGEYVHEELVFPDGMKFQHIKGDLLHYSYYNYKDHKERADKYSKLTAEKMHKAGKKAGPLKPLLSAFARFVGMYFIKMGILDGKMGFMIAWISAKSNHYKYQVLRNITRNDRV
ncbi:MAG: glycosyltransferase family 2 protein [Salibacteraceae bacterium]